jgi:hypothetical protein
MPAILWAKLPATINGALLADLYFCDKFLENKDLSNRSERKWALAIEFKI